jgi:VanZ family protein
VIWAAIIFAVSSIPSLGTGLGLWDLILRKIAHAVEYAVLASLFWRAISRWWPALALAIAYAATDELHQHFVRGRAGSPRDVLIDAGGALAGLGACLWYRRRFAPETGPSRRVPVPGVEPSPSETFSGEKLP